PHGCGVYTITAASGRDEFITRRDGVQSFTGGSGGNETICGSTSGQPGNTIHGGSGGNETIAGGGGSDTITGGSSGDELINGWMGGQSITAGSGGSETIFGSASGQPAVTSH